MRDFEDNENNFEDEIDPDDVWVTLVGFGLICFAFFGLVALVVFVGRCVNDRLCDDASAPAPVASPSAYNDCRNLQAPFGIDLREHSRVEYLRDDRGEWWEVRVSCRRVELVAMQEH